MRFSTWNIQRMRIKETEVIREIEELNMYIVLLTETKKKVKAQKKRVIIFNRMNHLVNVNQF